MNARASQVATFATSVVGLSLVVAGWALVFGLPPADPLLIGSAAAALAFAAAVTFGLLGRLIADGWGTSADRVVVGVFVLTSAATATAAVLVALGSIVRVLVQ